MQKYLQDMTAYYETRIQGQVSSSEASQLSSSSSSSSSSSDSLSVIEESKQKNDLITKSQAKRDEIRRGTVATGAGGLGTSFGLSKLKS